MRLAAFIAALCFVVALKAQGTTIEVYNYVTRGYATQIQQGLDMKAGYTWQELSTNTQKGVMYSFKRLWQGETPVAILIIYTDRQGTGYLCIPTANSDELVLSRAMADYFEFCRADASGSRTQNMQAALMGLAMLAVPFKQ